MLDFFGAKAWSPSGSRPHLLLTTSYQVADYAKIVTTRARDWWNEQGHERSWDDVVREIPAERLHITLAKIDRLTAGIKHADWDRLRDTVTAKLAELPPTQVRIGAPVLRPYALELMVHPDPEVVAIAEHARAAVREMLGADVAPPAGKPFRPHMSVLYGAAEFDDAGLLDAVSTGILSGVVVTMPARAILVDVLQDSSAPGGYRWATETAAAIPIGR